MKKSKLKDKFNRVYKRICGLRCDLINLTGALRVDLNGLTNRVRAIERRLPESAITSWYVFGTGGGHGTAREGGTIPNPLTSDLVTKGEMQKAIAEQHLITRSEVFDDVLNMMAKRGEGDIVTEVVMRKAIDERLEALRRMLTEQMMEIAGSTRLGIIDPTATPTAAQVEAQALQAARIANAICESSPTINFNQLFSQIFIDLGHCRDLAAPPEATGGDQV